VLAEQPWGVGRPWGVTVFWILLCVVVPAAVFRAGMAVVDRVRPRRSAGRAGRHRGLRPAELTLRMPWVNAAPRTPADDSASPVPALPWFTADNDPGTGAHGQLSAPQENGPTTQTRKGHT
jgi:hypothetical protein